MRTSIRLSPGFTSQLTSGSALAGFAAILFAAFVLISALFGAVPRETVNWLTNMGLIVVAGIGLGAALVFFALGWMLGKTVTA